MKKKYLILLLVFVSTIFTGFAADRYTTNRNDLPEAAQKFLAEHFPKAKIGMIKIDSHVLKKTDYDVKLVDGTKIEFNNAGNWTSVDCKTREVPAAIIPKAIRTYVSKNFPDVKIVEIEKTATKYKVELSDDVELTFNLLGQFKSMKLDD